MKKIKTLEDIPVIINYMEENNLMFNLYSDYDRSGAYIDPCQIIYIDEGGWHYYYTEKGERITKIYNISRDDLMRCIDGNLMQINDRYWDRNFYMFARNYLKK